MKTKVIAILITLSGIYVGLKGAGNLTVYGHLHEPGDLIYDSAILDSIVEGNPEKEKGHS